MYTLVFNANTIQDLWDHHPNNPNRPLGQKAGRQLFGTVVTPDCGVFTTGTNSSPKLTGTETTIPKIVCPYQVNDIIAIQEKWARSGDGYVYYDYNNETNNQGYTFRPAATMPLDATRMYARIVSTRVWSITQEIRDKYINAGVSTDSAAGTAAVVGYADKALELLSSIRNSHNNAALASTYQPLVPTEVPIREEAQYFMMYQKVKPSITVNGRTYTAADSTMFAQAYESPTVKWTAYKYNDAGEREIGPDGKYISEERTDYPLGVPGHTPVKYGDAQPAGQPISSDHGRWYVDFATANSDLGTSILVGDSIFSWNGDNKVILPTVKGSDGANHPIPIYATFNAKHTDPSQHLFTWMISAYLCDETGKIYGNWYGKNFQA